MDDEIIRLEDVDFYYDKGKPNEVHALIDVNISIQRGKFVSFFGSSGCGKSTILYMISGIEEPRQGHVWVNGHDLTKFTPQEMALYRQMGIGLIFQNFNLIPSVSVIDNVMLPMAFLGLSEAKRRVRALEIFKELDITHLIDRYPYELSGGQQQRVGIARALANDPPIVLADEPTGNLDSVNATKTMELLRDLSDKQGKTVILVTHEAWSLQYVDTVFYMKDGQLVKTENQKKYVGTRHGKGIKDEEHLSVAEPMHDTSQIRAHAIAQLLFRGYSKAELERAEEIILKRIQGSLNQDGLVEALDMQFRKGGLGLWRQRAERTAKLIEETIKEEFQLEKLHKKLQANPLAPVGGEIDDLRRWLIDGSKDRLSPYQLDSFREIITERLQSIITPDHFKKVLELPRKEGGIGFSPVLASRISDRFEMLMAMNTPEPELPPNA